MRYLLSFLWLFAFTTLAATVASAKPVLHFMAAPGLPVEVSDYSFTLPAARPLAVDFAFGSADAAHLERLFHDNLGQRVSARIGEQVLLTPVIRTVPSAPRLELTVADAAARVRLVEALSRP